MLTEQPDPNSNKMMLRIGQATHETLIGVAGLVKWLHEHGLYITTVESCTGGLLAGLITSVEGSSEVMKDSFVTYSNEAKIALGVPEEIITEHSVYSTVTAVAMARAGLARSVRADIAVGITGSLSRVDPANSAASIPGEVYIGMIVGAAETSQKINVTEPHRYLAKLIIAKAIIDSLAARLR